LLLFVRIFPVFSDFFVFSALFSEDPSMQEEDFQVFAPSNGSL